MIKITLFLLSIFDKIHQKKIIKIFKDIFNNKINILFDVGAHKGENVKAEDSSLSKREWNELMIAFNLKDKLI